MGGSWILDLINSLGYPGIALLMCLENLFPPIPSELIMPLAGALATRGNLSLPGVVVAGTAGSLVGQAAWYWLGWHVGERRLRQLVERHGRWLTLAPGDIDRARDWLVRHGVIALMIGRLVPTVRTLISLPAGLARVPPWRFFLYSAVGTSAWTGALALAGYGLQARFTRVNDVLGPASTAIVASMVGWYLWRVATHRQGRAATPASHDATTP
ncbi:alkaline phosphatase [Luteitalea sp. TBR-22]|uniref:DedA family protein n=1 Tax=Luteitalea sp. TBR-22 TaxID=2802971 RepID=UPI001AF0A2E1|nr:DedA family protein [Luteitalea sp. TBR-22]BCS33821.1 alkaline phosphatase [Luteitalea sp. TBR-22]